MRRLARLLPLLVLLVLLALAAYVLLQAGPLTEHLRKLVQQELRVQLDREVTIGGASLTFTGGVNLREVVIRNRDGSVLLRAPKIEARVGGLKDLITRKSNTVELRSIHLLRPELNLIRQPDGTLNISDLLGKKKEPSKFRATIIADDGTVTFVDAAAGGQTTTVSGAKVTVRYPSSGVTRFTLSAPSNKGAFEALDLRGESDSATQTTKLSGSAEGLSVPFAVTRIPGFKALNATAGAADVKGELTLQGAGPTLELDYSATADIREAELSFPWLHRPVKQVTGRIQLAEGEAKLRGLEGTVADAPAKADGCIRLTLVPEFDLDLEVTGIRYPQVKALFPKVALPLGLLLPSPMRIRAKIEGPANQLKVTGDASLKVIKFHAIPWHDMVGKFQYENGKLKINNLKAHGSPRQFEADFEIDLRGSKKATGSLSLINMPASMLAQMAGVEGDYRGLVKARVTGFVGNGSSLTGDFTVDGAGVGKLPLGQLRGEFTYGPTGVKLRRVRISGPTAEGQAEADISPDGCYTLTGRLSSLNLGAVGPALKLTGLKGQCCAQVRASGAARAKRGTAQVTLGPGELQGQPFDSLTAALVFTPGKVEVNDLALTSPAGRAQGALTLAGLDQPREFSQLRGDFTFSQLAVAPLLPPSLASLVTSGTMTGSASFSGTVSSPLVTAEVRGAGLVVTGRPVETAFARASYRNGRFAIDEVSLKTQDGQLALAGGYNPERGLDLTLTGQELELASAASELRERFGVSLRGALNITATLTGELTQPRADINAQAQNVTANSLLFDELDLQAVYERGLVKLDTFKLRRGEGVVQATGTAALDGSSLDLTATAEKVTLGTLISIGDSAVWRLYRGGKRYPFSLGTTAYRAL